MARTTKQPIQPVGLADIDELKGEVSRRSLKEFIRFFWPVVEPAFQFVDGYHLDAICDHLIALTKREIKNLLINIPPRHCKSTLCSVMFPAWQWLHNPSEQFLYTSYSINLAERDSTRCRRLIGSDLYQKCYGKRYKLQDDQNTKRRFENDKNGYRLISSVLAMGTTGEGGSIICVDDPHSVNETESDLRRENACRWFAEVFFSRLNNPATGCRLVIGQRIHNEDLSGFILENYKSEWCHLNLPYEFSQATTKTTSIGWKDPRKYDGQPLWPEFFPESQIRQHKKNPKAFASQYNQNPLDTENALFKPENFRFYDESDSKFYTKEKAVRKDQTFTIITADLAISTNSKADYTALCVASIAKSGEVILLDMVRERLPGTAIVPRLIDLNEQYAPAYIIIEDVAFQRMVLDQARAEGLPVRAVKPIGDKEARSYPLQNKVHNGQVWFPKDRPWLGELQKELVEFPQGSHDDMVPDDPKPAPKPGGLLQDRQDVKIPNRSWPAASTWWKPTTTRENKTMKTTRKQQEQARAVVLAMAGLPRVNPQAIADIILAYDVWGWPIGGGMSAADMPNKAARRRLQEGIGRAVMQNLDARLKKAS